MSQKPTFPEPVRLNNRVYFPRHKLEKYKRALLALALGVAANDADNEPEPAVIELVAAPQAAREMGYTRRTLGRRFKGQPSDAAA